MPKDPLESITFSSRYLRNSGKKSKFTLGTYNDTFNKFDSSRKFTLKRNWIIVEEAKSRRKSNVLSNLHSKPHVVNNSSENENNFRMNNFLPGDVTYADDSMSVNRYLTGHRRNCIVIFDDIITERIQVRDLIRELEAGHVKIKLSLIKIWRKIGILV